MPRRHLSMRHGRVERDIARQAIAVDRNRPLLAQADQGLAPHDFNFPAIERLQGPGVESDRLAHPLQLA